MKRKTYTNLLSALLLLVCSNLLINNAGAQTYCTPTFTNGCDGFNPWHNNSISLNTLSWTIGSTSCTTYDYTSMSTTLVAGTTYTMTVASGVYTGCTVWIDLNDNGSFEDPGENFYHSYVAGPGGYETYTFPITIPACSPAGTHRMRVLAGWGTDGYDVSTNGYGSCGTITYSYGNFDDFTLHVTPAACDTPVALTATTVTATTATFNWVAPPCVTSFEYVISTSSVTPTASASGTVVTDTNVTATGLTPGITYYMFVRSLCSVVDTSTWVDVAATTINPCGEPVTPTVTGATPTTASFSWSAPTLGTVGSYQYTINTTGVTPTSPGTTTTATSCTETGLAAGTTYYFFVRTICAMGDSSVWEEVTFTTPLPCDPPTGLYASPLAPTTATINWVTPGGAPVTGYQYVNSVTATPPTGAGIPISTLSVPLGGLTPATTYYFYIRTMCADGDSSAWVGFSYVTPEPCDVPADLGVSYLLDNGATITWATPGGAPVANYQYVFDGTPSAPTGAGITTTATTYSVTGLTPVTTYYFHIRTMCADGDSSAWVTLPFTTRPICGSPTILTHDTTYEGIHIVWSSVFEAIQYQYQLDNNPAPPITPGTATTDTVYNMVGLSPLTTYYFHLSVICSGGDAPWQTLAFSTLRNTTGISNVNSSDALSINVSPNPANNYVNVVIDGTPANNANIQLTDMAGRILLTIPVTEKTIRIALSEIPQGMYFVHYLDDKRTQTVKLVK
jgi:hypothetical protein